MVDCKEGRIINSEIREGWRLRDREKEREKKK